MTSPHSVPVYEDENRWPFNLHMNAEDAVTMMTLAAGMQPTILIKIVQDDAQEDGCRVDIETWGIPADPSELAEFFAGAAELLDEEITRRMTAGSDPNGTFEAEQL